MGSPVLQIMESKIWVHTVEKQQSKCCQWGEENWKPKGDVQETQKGGLYKRESEYTHAIIQLKQEEHGEHIILKALWSTKTYISHLLLHSKFCLPDTLNIQEQHPLFEHTLFNMPHLCIFEDSPARPRWRREEIHWQCLKCQWDEDEPEFKDSHVWSNLRAGEERTEAKPLTITTVIIN